MRKLYLPLWVKVVPFYVAVVFLFALPSIETHRESINANKAASLATVNLAANHKTPATQTIALTHLIQGYPERIVIPSVGIDVSIVPGVHNDAGAWSVAPDTANYYVGSAQPNNHANQTYLYGHWSSNVFGPTVNLGTDAIAYVYTTNNHVFEYSFTSYQVIPANDTTFLAHLNGKPGLDLTTCQGTFAQDRRLMFFNFVKAS